MVDLQPLIQALREKRKTLTLDEIARATGLSTTTINRIETGATQKPGWETIKALAAYLQLPLTSLVGHVEQPTPDLVEQYLDADPNISAKAKQTLNTIFRTAYQHYTAYA